MGHWNIGFTFSDFLLLICIFYRAAKSPNILADLTSEGGSGDVKSNDAPRADPASRLGSSRVRACTGLISCEGSIIMLHDGDGWTLDWSMVRVKARAKKERSFTMRGPLMLVESTF